MERIIYGNKLAPSLFEENVYFNEERPYTISIKRFEADEVTIPHYAKTFEILILGDVTGEVVVEGLKYNQIGCSIFAIPPYFVHSMRIKASKGTVYVLKCSFENIECFLNLHKFAEHSRTDLDSLLICRCNELYERIMQLVENMIKHDCDLFYRMIHLLEIFSILIENSRVKIPQPVQTRSDAALRKVIDWTVKNYASHITIENAADVAGYNKYHFCHWFKNTTDLTYLEYLTQVRLIKATQFLQGSMPVGEVSVMCGYENVSHFIRQFKKLFGCTPKHYIMTNSFRT
jgi:AraC-like DNA-binding protein